MPAVHIRDMPEEVIEALKRRAARNHRSLQKELRYILISMAHEEPIVGVLPPIELKFSDATQGGDWSREEIYRDDGR
jgi:plasmid stability protein